MATDTYAENHFSETKKRGITGKKTDRSELTENGAIQSQSRSLVGSLTGNVSLVAGNELGIHGSDVFAANNVTLAADRIAITAGVDVNESHLTQSSKRSLSALTMDNKHNSQDDRFSVTRSGSTISAGNQINLAAGQLILLEGAHLDATTVKVTSLAPEGSTPTLIIAGSLGENSQSHTESSETGYVWQKASGYGSSAQTYEQTTINGDLIIDPKFQIHVQTANPNLVNGAANLSATLQALATSDPGLGYLQDLAHNPNVNWEAITLAQDQWDYSQSGLTPAGAAILVIAVTVATQGWGTEFAGSLGATTTAAIPATATTAGAAATIGGSTALAAAANAGMSAILASASVSLVNNHGNLKETLKDLGSDESLKNILISMTTAGLVSGMNTAFFGEGSAFLTGQTGANANSILNKQIANNFANNVIKNMATNLVSTGVNSAISGDGLNSDSLANALTKAFITAGLAQGATSIGDAFDGGQINEFTRQLAHAMLGCAGGVATSGNSDGCAPGAVGAVVGELSARYAKDVLHWDDEKALAFAGVIVAQDGNDAGAVNLANTMGDNAARYNYLFDHEKAKLDNARRSCERGNNTACKEVKLLETLDKKRDDIQLAGILNQPGLDNVYPESLFLGGAVIKGTGQVLGAVGNSVLNLTPQAVVVGGGIGGVVNAGAQYWINDGKIDWGNVGITAGVGALTFGTGFLYTVGANGAAGGYMNYKQGDSVIKGILIGGGSAGIGWGFGTTITNGFNPIFNPIRNSYTFYPPAAGSYFLRTPPVSPVPNILGGFGSSGATEFSAPQLNKPLNQTPKPSNQNRGKK